MFLTSDTLQIHYPNPMNVLPWKSNLKYIKKNIIVKLRMTTNIYFYMMFPSHICLVFQLYLFVYLSIHYNFFLSILF